MVFLDLFLQDERGSDVDGHSGIVAFAVTGSAFDEWIVKCDAGSLGGTRNAVFVGDKSDDGFAGAVGSDPSGGNAGNSLFYFKAVSFENAGDVTRSFKFLEAEFAVAENLIHHLLGEGLEPIGFFGRFAF